METTSTQMISKLYETGIITHKATVALLLQIEAEKTELLTKFKNWNNSQEYKFELISDGEINEFLKTIEQ